MNDAVLERDPAAAASKAATTTTALATTVSLDPQNPWLGLSSYTEETRAYFHGRDEEAAELARRVQRKLLTVLFGQSGLGKTSLLRAGLVPRLRGEGFCPVYVRVDYSADSPPPADQIKQAIFRATAEAGHWTRPGTAVAGESLWEFLHHRGDLLRDAAGRTVLPLLIFDQFEEIFTLAQVDDRGRLRAKQFLDELADLVENRPPADLERRIDNEEVDAGEFDFARADYRILIALREDYLAHLEGVKATMPSITQNRMRLARMTGAQALVAVMKPGGRLVTQEVAESIVRFVAGGSELPNAEVEPSLLSLICRELNIVRQSQGRSEISADLLAGSRDTILSEFYERALADQPADVRRVIEDELLTESGYRESLAEERVQKALAAAGAAPDALAKLVDRRLLRIEERLDLRRVELTHDVLCNVVKASRDLRHEREARDEAERQLVAQQERAAETRRTLRRTRRFAMVAAALMLVATVSAFLGWINWQRARAADAAAQQARALADRARSDAERLVGFLIEDFYNELQPTGRLETMGKLAHMAVSYYDALPAELLTPQTKIYRGMALIREGGATLARGDVQAANPALEEAYRIFDQLRASGNHSEAVLAGLALAKFTRYSLWGVQGAPGSQPDDLPNAVALLKPLMQLPGTSADTRMLYADILNYYSHTLPPEQRLAVCEESRAILAKLGAKDLSNLRAASIYGDTSDSEARHAIVLGKLAEAESLEKEVYQIAEGVLAQRPGDLRSMSNRALAPDLLARLAQRRYDFVTAADYARKSYLAGDDYVRFNPSDLNSWQYSIMDRDIYAGIVLEQGRVADALATNRTAVAFEQDPRKSASLQPQLWQTWLSIVLLEGRADLPVAQSFEQFQAAARAAAAMESEDSPRRPLYDLAVQSVAARLELMQGNPQAAADRGNALIARLLTMDFSKAHPDAPGFPFWTNILRNLYWAVSVADLELGRYPEAEKAARARNALVPDRFSALDPQDAVSRTNVLVARALVGQHREAEARTIVDRELARYRNLQKAGAHGVSFQTDLAFALYVSALGEPATPEGRAQRVAQLAEAEQALGVLPAEARKLYEARRLGQLIGEARQSTTI